MKYLYLTFLLFVFSSCSEWTPFSEEQIEKTMELEKGLKEIHVDGIFNVKLIQSENPRVVFSGNKAQYKQIKRTKTDTSLRVSSERMNLWKSNYQKPTLMFYQDSIEEFWIHGPVNLSTPDTLQARMFKLFLICELAEADVTLNTNFFGIYAHENSAGAYQFRGHTKTFSCRLRGSSHVLAKSLKANDVRIEQISIGDMYVHASHSITIYSHNSGDVYYTGNPEKKKIELNASGEVFSLE